MIFPIHYWRQFIQIQNGWEKLKNKRKTEEKKLKKIAANNESGI